MIRYSRVTIEEVAMSSPTHHEARDRASHDGTDRRHGADQPSRAALNGLAFSATLHCLTGCVIGEVAGMAIGTALGLSLIHI